MGFEAEELDDSKRRFNIDEYEVIYTEKNNPNQKCEMGTKHSATFGVMIKVQLKCQLSTKQKVKTK